jgi:5'-nucleotidase
MRLIKTLGAWGVTVNESFFMGGVSKAKVLESFKPHIYFDDQPVHLDAAAKAVAAARVIEHPIPGMNTLSREERDTLP